ncbi:PstS family phosphate ABC transporter substrate-binding protein [Pirellulaceae bacterium SH467]
MRVAVVCCLLFITMGWSGVASAQTRATPASNPVAIQAGGVATGSSPSAPDSQHLALMSLLECLELYHPAKDLQGAAKLSGSTTMMLLGKAWADRFRNFHTKVEFTRGPDGTDAGIKALAEDPTLIVGASRPISEQEIALLKAGKCKEPMSIIVALDPLALYVHESNPLAAVTPEQLEGILRAPDQKGIHHAKWGELGVTGALADQSIRIHARSEIAGTTAFIKQFLLRGENVAKEVGSHMSSQAVCEAIAKDTAAVGIAGFGDAVPGVRTVALSLKGTVVPANEQSFLSGQYPLVRPLVLVFDKAQMKTDGGLRESMLRYILSRDGQMEAIRAGFFPLDPSFIHKELDEICGTQMR